MDPLKYGWKDKNGCYAPNWFMGPAVPDDLFREGDDSMVLDDLQSDQPVVATAFDDAEDSSSELPWSDDSESETEI